MFGRKKKPRAKSTAELLLELTRDYGAAIADNTRSSAALVSLISALTRRVETLEQKVNNE